MKAAVEDEAAGSTDRAEGALGRARGNPSPKGETRTAAPPSPEGELTEAWPVSSFPDFIEFVEDTDGGTVCPDLVGGCTSDLSLGHEAPDGPLAVPPQIIPQRPAQADGGRSAEASPWHGRASTRDIASADDLPAPQEPLSAALPETVEAPAALSRHETRVQPEQILPARPASDHAGHPSATIGRIPGAAYSTSSDAEMPLRWLIPSAERTDGGVQPGVTSLPASVRSGDNGHWASEPGFVPGSGHLSLQSGHSAHRNGRPNAAPSWAAGPSTALPSTMHARDPDGKYWAVQSESRQDAESFVVAARQDVDATARSQPSQAPSPMPSARSPGPEVVAQLGAAIQKTASDTVELRLDPRELGHVRVSLTTWGDQLTAQISAERPETGDMMRRHADLLQRELADSGFRNVTLEFGTAAQHGQGGSEEASENRRDLSDNAGDEGVSAATSVPGDVQETGLNLRL